MDLLGPSILCVLLHHDAQYWHDPAGYGAKAFMVLAISSFVARLPRRAGAAGIGGDGGMILGGWSSCLEAPTCWCPSSSP